METMQVLHMNKGAGKTSYATNSIVQVSFFTTGQILSCNKKKVDRSLAVFNLIVFVN